jgi:hypothetical protein
MFDLIKIKIELSHYIHWNANKIMVKKFTTLGDYIKNNGNACNGDVVDWHGYKKVID